MITREPAALLADVWPTVAARLTRMLRRRGVDGATAEDVVQETAVRVLHTGVPYADGDDLFRWASVVGWRLAVDARRRDRRAEPGPVPDRQSPINVALAVEHRTALEAVGRELRRLSPSDRSAILDPVLGVEGDLTRQQSTRLAVRRHRARNRLLMMTKGLLGVIGGLVARRRGPGVPRSGVVAAIGAPAALVAFVIVPSVGPAPDVAAPPPAGVVRPPAARATATTAAPAAPAPPPVTAAPAATLASAAPAPAAPPGPAGGRPPVVEVTVPDPLGGTTTVGARPRQPDDHTLCVEVPGLSLPCLDAPLPPLPLPPLPPLPPLG